MADLVANGKESLKFNTDSRFVYFRTQINEQLPFYSDRHRVATVLNNLLSNAVIYQRANEPSPTINLHFHADSSYGYLTIHDNGEGIAADKIDKIFEMFYRNSEKSVGSGLGLYICKEIVNKLGGLISVTSEQGRGSSFIVKLPNLKP